MNNPRPLQKVALVLFGASLCVVLLEVGARAYAHFARQDRVLIYDSLLGWKPLPDARKLYTSEEQPYLIEINSQGLRDREYSYEKPPGVFRILVLGDSFVFGSGGVEQPRLFTELLESSAPKLEVINAGVPGYSPDQEFLFLQAEGYRYQPDLVVVCLFLNDFRESFVSFNTSIGRPKGFAVLHGDAMRFHPPSFGLLYRAFQSSYLLGWLDQRLRVTARLARRASSQIAMDGDLLRPAFSRLLVEMRDLCRSRSAELVVVYFPFKAQQKTNVLQEILNELSSREQIPVIDFFGLLRPKGDPESSFFLRDVHLNERGHALVARQLLGFLSQRTALGKHLSPPLAAPVR